MSISEQDKAAAIKRLQDQFSERFKRKPSTPTPDPTPTTPVHDTALTSERLVTVPAPIGTRYGGTPLTRPVYTPPPDAYVTTGPALSPEAEADMNSPEFQAAAEEFFAGKEREEQERRGRLTRPVYTPPVVIDTIVTPISRCEACDVESDDLVNGECPACRDEGNELNEAHDALLVAASIDPFADDAYVNERSGPAADAETNGWTDGAELDAILATPATTVLPPILMPDPIDEPAEELVTTRGDVWLDRYEAEQARGPVLKPALGPNAGETPTLTLAPDAYAGALGIGRASSAIREYLAYLRGQFVERDEMLHAALVAIVARQHVAYIGPAGSAKSQCIRFLMRGITDVTHASYQGNSFSTPDEMLGQVSMHALERDDEYVRKLDGRMGAVELYELDEAFRLTNKAFNVLLRALNEREIFNPGAVGIPLHTMFVASNTYPADEELRALRDRFAVKLFVEYVSAENFVRMMRMKQDDTPAVTCPWAAFKRLSAEVEVLVDDADAIPDRIMQLLLELRTKLGEQNVTMSDRIMKWAKPLLLACALLDGRTTVVPSDLWFLQHVLWDDRKDYGKVRSAIEALVGRLDADLDEISAMLLSVGSAFEKEMTAARQTGTVQKRIDLRVDGQIKHDSMRERLQNLAPTVPDAGETRDKYERISAALITFRNHLSDRS